MKKLISLLLACAMLAMLLVGCGNANNSNTADSKAADDSKQTEAQNTNDSDAGASDNTATGEYDMSKAQGKKVGFTVPTLASDFINYLTQAAVDAFAEIGVECQIDSCDGDVTKQIEQMENYVAMGMDAIIAFPVNGEALGVAAQNAVNAGVPVFAFAMDIPNATSKMISAEESVMGAACGEMASDWIDENYPDAADGSVVVYVMRGSTQPEIVVRSDSIVAKLKENPKITVIEEESENQDDQNVARRMTENQFNANHNIYVFVGCNAECGLGANSYIMSSDSPVKDLSKFAIFIVDENTEVDENIKASITNESAIRGTISMGGIPDTIADMMKGMIPILTEGEIIPRIDGSIFPITADNVDEALNK